MNSSNLPPLPLIDGCLFIDNSGWVESMSTCHRFLQYRSLNGRVLAADKPSLNFGSAIHLGLELRYSRYQNKPVDEQYYADLSVIFTKHFEEHPVPMDDWRTLNWAMAVMRKYNERYANEEFGLLRYDEPQVCPYCEGKDEKCVWCQGTGKREVMVELSFALPLFVWRPTDRMFTLIHGLNQDDYVNLKTGQQEIPIIYTGRIDLPISLDGKIWVKDHKTTSMLGQSFFDGKRLSSQQRGYAWAFQELTKKPVHGFIVNAIRTKEPPQYLLKGELQSKVGDEIIVSQSYRKSKTTDINKWWEESLQRERYLLKPGDLEEWKNNVIDLVEEFFWHYQRGYMPMKTEWCVRYGLCPYYEVCRLSQQDRGVMLSSGMFADNNWSPLKQPTQSKQ